MPMIARVEAGQVVELRTGDIQDVPVHKRTNWRTVVEVAPPAVNTELSTVLRDGYTLSDTIVTEKWVVLARSPEEQKTGVQREAYRRIALQLNLTQAPIELMPQVLFQQLVLRQLNALMRAVDLLDKKAGGTALTAQEQAVLDQTTTSARRIRQIITAGDAIENTVPIPANFKNNSLWPT